jgi:hypothetical protein
LKKLTQNIRAFAAISLFKPRLSQAAQGAFEQDFQLYFQNLANGNSGKLKAKRTPLPSPRKLDSAFCTAVLNSIDDRICLLGNCKANEIHYFVKENTPPYLSYFETFVPITYPDFRDQYYFDISIFLHYLFAKSVIPESKERVKFRELVANDILRLMNVEFPLSRQSFPSSLAYVGSGIRQILDKSVTLGLIGSYVIDDEDLYDLDYLKNTFEKV